MTRRASIWFCLAVQAFFTFTFPSEAHPALPTVITAPCPTRPDALGCADLDDDLLYVLPGLRMPGRRLVIAHERGHFFDLWHPGVRAITGLGPERFADAYARCRYRGEAWRGAGFGRVLLGVCEVVTWPA